MSTLDARLAQHDFSPSSTLFARPVVYHAVKKYDSDRDQCISRLCEDLQARQLDDKIAELLTEILEGLILFIDIKTCSAGLFEDTETEVAGAEQQIVHYTVSRFIKAFS